jgi:murein DD-endopeptidase MepM/ murein hydrolase activator NlpD
VALAVIVAGAAAAPAAADTQGRLDDAKKQLADARARLEQAAAQWQRAEADLSRSRDRIGKAQAEITRLNAAFSATQQRFDRRVREMYMAGGSPTVAALLTSDSIADVVDRWEFAASVAQGDQDLATEVAVQAELLRRERAHLADAIVLQADAAQRLAAAKEAADARVAELADKVAELQDELEAQRAIGTGGGPIASSGAIRTCPVAGPNAFVDSFGDPRPGGRTHQGIDMIAPFGTPVVAVHDGTAHQTTSVLGGLGVVVYHDGSADWTFYTHFSSFGATGHVSAGTIVGYVGATGDTSVNHLHFEYHPGGGAAIDPYNLLLAVC